MPMSLDYYRAALKTQGNRKKGKRSNLLAKQKKADKPKLDTSTIVTQGRVELTLPVETVSEANKSEHWTVKHQRHKAQQTIVHLALLPIKCHIKIPCQIHLIRYASKSLDKFDNLPMSFKYIVDRIASVILNDFIPGHADNDPRFSFSCDQVISKHYGIKIIITF